ncbi:hypothetical protein ABPG72_018240 [Tetrahymena utriculariae]
MIISSLLNIIQSCHKVQQNCQQDQILLQNLDQSPMPPSKPHWSNAQLLNYTDLFFQKMYDKQLQMVQCQNSLVIQNHQEQVQYQIQIINLLQQVYSQTLRGQIIFNSNFTKPVLNIQKTYNQIGDPYLLNMYKKNSSDMISSWHSKDTHKLQDLPLLSFDQIRNTSFIDFIWKAALFNERISFRQNLVNINVKLYFMAFNSDGMFYGSGINITSKNITDPYPCPKSTFHLDSRCQEYFQQVMQTVQFQCEGYIPTHFLYTIDNQPYVGLGICKKTYVDQSFMSKYKIPYNLTISKNPFSIICNSINLEKSIFYFQNVGNQKAIRIFLDPYFYRVAYQSDLQIQSNKILTLQESYLSRLQSEEQKQYFLEQINQFRQNYLKRFCSSDKSYVFSQQFNKTIQQFTINVKNQKMIVIQQFTFYIDKIYVRKEDGDIEVQYCFKNSLLLLTILTQDQLQSQAITLSQQVIQINMFFKVFFYGFISLSILLSFYYSQKISIMIENSLKHLTDILKKLKVDQEAKKFIFFKDGMHSGDLQIDHSELLFSSDLSLLYQSFQNLFQTLIYTTQSLFDQDESQILINLTKQVGYFQQFKNYRALGICYNNIANIHFNNSRYLEALENYSQSVVCCKYELNAYQHSQYQIDFKNQQEFKQNIREKKSKSSILESLIQKINSLSIFRSKLDNIKSDKLDFKFQEDKFMNIQKYGIYEIYIEKKELQQMLFNRKYNFIRALIFHTLNQDNFLLFSDMFESLVQELVDLRNPDKIEGYKQKILLNQLFQSIYFYQQEQQKCEQVVQENNMLFQYIKQINILKPQNVQQTRIESQQNSIPQIKPQSNQLNNCTSFQFQLPTKIQSKITPKAEQHQQQIFELSQKENTLFKPLNTFAKNTKDQENYILSSYSLTNTETFLSINKLLRENKPQDQSHFEKKNQNDLSKQTEQIRNKQYKKNKNLRTDQSESPKVNQQASPKFHHRFRQITNQTQSIMDQSPQLKANSSKFNQSQKANPFSSSKHQKSNSGTFYNNQSINSIQSQQKYFSNSDQNNQQVLNQKKVKDVKINLKHFQNLEKSQLKQKFKENQQNINKIYDNYKQLDDGQIKSKKRKTNKINDYGDNEGIKMQNNSSNSINSIQNDFSEKDYSYYSSLLSNRSKVKLQYDCFGNDRNQYQINDDQIFNLVQEQHTLMYILQKNYYQAAKSITKMYEKSQLVVSQQFSINIQRLLSIFDNFGINCPFLEQIYKKLTQNISFKICVVYFDEEQDLISQSSRTELNESNQSQIYDFNNFQKKAKLLDLLLDIIEQVVIREDDYFGFISSSQSDMSIKEYISVINNIQANQQVIKDTLCNFLVQNERKNSKIQKQNNQTQNIHQQQQMGQFNQSLIQSMKYQSQMQEDYQSLNYSNNSPIQKIQNNEILIQKTQQICRENDLKQLKVNKQKIQNDQNKNMQIQKKQHSQQSIINLNDKQANQQNQADNHQKNYQKTKTLDKLKEDTPISSSSSSSQKIQQKSFQTNNLQFNNKTHVSSITQFDDSVKVEKINIILDVDVNQGDLKKNKIQQLSPIKEEISKRFFFYDEIESQKNIIQQAANSEVNQQVNRYFEKNSKNTNSIMIDQFKQNDFSFSEAYGQRESKINQYTKNKSNYQTLSCKLQFIKLEQLMLSQLDEQNSQTKISQISNNLIKQKRTLFYFTIRKALQQVASQYEGLPILFQLNTLQNQKKMQSKYQAAMKEHVQKNKKEFMNNIFFQNNQKKKYFQKIIIAVLDDHHIIDQNDQEFQFLLQNFKNFQVELCILLQNDQISTDENTFFKSKYIDQICVLSYFYSQKSLLLYLLNYRFTKCFGYIPLIVEHF